MKIIELLNKIANNEEVPKKIKVSCFEFEWRAGGRYYENTTKGNYQTLLQDWLNNANKLNSEVEIMEEEKEMPEKFKVHSLGDKDENGSFVSSPFPTDEEFMDKINDIIDYLDYLKSKGE